MSVKRVYFDSDYDYKWYVGHHKYINDTLIKARNYMEAVSIFDEYIKYECSDDTYTSDITGVNEIDDAGAKELEKEFYICEDLDC